MSRLPRDHDDASAPPETHASPPHPVHRPALQGHVVRRHLGAAAITAPDPERLG